MRLVFFLLFCTSFLFAQTDTLNRQKDAINQSLVEDFLQDTDAEGEFDYNTVFEQLEDYALNPLDLNLATEIQLRELGLLNDIQVIDFINYRAIAGALISLYELQSIPSFDLNTIQTVLPYVTIRRNTNDYNIPIQEMLYQGKNELYLRWSRILEQQRGYLPLAEGETSSRYLGDPNKLYVRFKHSYGNKLSYGITAEKDRGEEFFRGSNPQGFDFYSMHFFLKDYNQTIKGLALGDYTITFGQGLILYSGFNYGKSANVVNIKRSGRTLRQYTSVNEANFMRGAGATIGLGRNLEVTAFASYRGRDGNIIFPDSTDADLEVITLSSLDEDGLHRTASEIEDENAVFQFTTGGSVKYNGNNWHVALNAVYDQLDKELLRTPRPYNQYQFTGNQLLNTSLDYSIIYRNFNFFGETAMSDNGAIATINGVLVGLDRNADLSILHRYFPRNFQTLNGDPFAETVGAVNEEGIYLGIETRPHLRWKISGFFDSWKHNWLRFSSDAPTSGYEYRARITYHKKRDLTIYFEYRSEHKETNAPANETKVDYIIPTQLTSGRIYVSKKVNKALELRSRVDIGFADNEVQGRGNGIVFFQDLLYKPMNFPLSFTTRFAIFDTDGFRIRYYAYENDLLYSFSVPAYYNKGTRFYINFRYRPKSLRNLTLEARYAQTYWANQDTFGSGLEEIQGQTRTEVKAQIKYQF